jgi:peptide/nickel transport system ATP-binding protein
MVLQNPSQSLNPRRRVGPQILDGLPAAGASSQARQLKVNQLLDKLGLAEGSAAKYPHQFSGGQKQRIAIARAFAVAPSIVVLDEPLASLDLSAQAQLANLLKSLANEENVGMLVISHDLAILRHIVDEIAVMYLGMIVETAATSKLWGLPLHPYTEALIAAIPRANGRRELPPSLPGEVGDPADPPPGCRFHPRCPYAFERCATDTPPLLEVGQGRQVACWLHRPGDPLQPSANQHPGDLGAKIPIAI